MKSLQDCKLLDPLFQRREEKHTIGKEELLRDETVAECTVIDCRVIELACITEVEVRVNF